MARVARLPEAAIMMVIFLMAGKTIRWRAFEDLIDVTIFAHNNGMRSAQFESCQVMVKSGWLPTRSLVACSTVLAH